MINDEPVWKLEGTLAHLTTERLTAVVDLRRPNLGLEALAARINTHSVQLEATRILGVRAGRNAQEDDVELLDYYQRGDDLIVTNRLTASPDVVRQIYWRVVRDGPMETAGTEAIVSAQTDLLDSDPTATVGSTFPPGDVLTMGTDELFQPLALDDGATVDGGAALLIRPAGLEISLLEMAHPADHQETTISRSTGLLTTQHRVLTDRLEKGVIRRSRLRTMMLPRLNDCELALSLYQRFAASPLPLTT